MLQTEVLCSENSREQKGRQDSQMSEQPIKGLVFDMDGLLFDSERVVQKSWNEVGRQMGFGERFGDHIYHTIGFNVVRREQYLRSMYRRIFRWKSSRRIRVGSIIGSWKKTG